MFDGGTAEPGQFDVDVHTNGLSRGGQAADSLSARHRPLHLSVEVARGWTSRIETAVFVQTAPFGPSGSARFAGGHVRAKVRLGELDDVPLRFAVGVEYAFNRAVFDQELQTVELRSIIDYRRGQLSLVLNPTLEMVTRGVEDGLAPVFDISARAEWRVRDRVSISTDYFSAAATVRHLQPAPEAHHLVFAGLDLDLGSGWGVELSAGHCVIRNEPWVMRSVLGYSF